MKLQEKIGVRSVRLALGVLAGSLFIAGQAYAQEQVQRVEITGSSIKRIAVEGALPVQRVSAEAIARSGATNVAELMQSLPAMQGFTITATAAGSNSGGNVGSSIHDVGTGYTLVLLNGRRLAPQGSGSAVNLNAIQLSAIERIEILTDGASALYGSDAIAGVINFIMKKNQQGGSIEGAFNAPQASGGGMAGAIFIHVGQQALVVALQVQALALDVGVLRQRLVEALEIALGPGLLVLAVLSGGGLVSAPVGAGLAAGGHGHQAAARQRYGDRGDGGGYENRAVHWESPSTAEGATVAFNRRSPKLFHMTGLRRSLTNG